jgi:hypothetical protein
MESVSRKNMSELIYGNQGMEECTGKTLPCTVSSRRLEDRIRSLCADVVGTGEKDQFEQAISKLQSALREHNQRLRNLAVGKLTHLWSSPDTREDESERTTGRSSN